MLLALIASAFLWSFQAPPAADDTAALQQQAGEALKSDPARAATLYQQLVARKPDWAEGWFYLGVTRFQTKQFAAAKTALEKAAALDPEHGTVWAFLGLTEERLQQDAQALRDVEKGEQLGLADDPAFIVTVYQTAARLCLDAYAYSNAVGQLQVLAAHGDHSTDTVQLLGRAVLGQSTPPAHLEAAVTLAGEAAWQLYANHPAEAARLSEQLVTKYPDLPGAHYLRGICLLNSDRDAATAAFRSELKLSPKSAVARLQIAIGELRVHHPAEAERLAKEAVTLEPNNALAALVLGRALLDENKPQAALSEFQRAAKLDGSNAQAHFYLARAYHAMGREADTAREKATYEQLNTAANRGLATQ